MGHALPYFACVVFNGIFALHYVIAKEIINQGISIYSLSAWRGLIGGGIILAVFHKELKLEMLKSHFWSLVAIGLMGFFLNQILFMKGLKVTTPLDAALISNTIPVVSFVYATIFRLENLDYRRLSGILLSFGLVSYLVISGGKGQFELLNWGNLLVFVNVFFFCGALIKAKFLMNDGVPFHVLTGLMLFIGGSCMALVSGEGFMDLFHYGARDVQGASYVFFEVVISTSLVYLLNLWTIKRLRVSTVTFFNYLQPLGTSIAGILMYRELPEVDLLMVYLGILLGGYLVIKGPS